MALDETYELTGLLTEDCQYVQFNAWKMYQKTLRKWVGKDILVTIKVLRYKRSDKQNRYMFGVIVPYVRRWLYETQGEKFTPEQVYTWLRVKLLDEHPKITMIAGEEVVTMTGKKFSAMNTAEFAEAVDKIRIQMLERGLDIPEPKRGKANHNLLEEFLEDN